MCAPTAKTAVLNVGDLEAFLASGNLAVATTGSGVQADDIHVRSALGWSNSSTLSLEAHRSIAINAPMSITGQSGLTLDTGKRGWLSFGSKGNVSFVSLSSQLAINGSAFTLVGDIKTLANDVAANPSGDFALAKSYDATGDGTYLSPPVPTVFSGTFNGLGNTISHLSVGGAVKTASGWAEGFFAELGTTGILENIGLEAANISGQPRLKASWTGTLVGVNFGTIRFSYAASKVTIRKGSFGGVLVGSNDGTIMDSNASGVLKGKVGTVGGLVSDNEGIIQNSHAAVAVTVKEGAGGGYGGLAGENLGTVENSWATGNITVGTGGHLGALIGISGGAINNSYATGAVTGGTGSDSGGLVGENGINGTISFSYSTGAVAGGGYIGGLIGFDGAQSGSITDAYWDTDTSGITDPSQGAGNIANDPGVTGLSTAEFQSGLPQGFDPAVWAEKSNINGGLPYLLDNPPVRKH
jgi:hypothetical protein